MSFLSVSPWGRGPLGSVNYQQHQQGSSVLSMPPLPPQAQALGGTRDPAGSKLPPAEVGELERAATGGAFTEWLPVC